MATALVASVMTACGTADVTDRPYDERKNPSTEVVQGSSPDVETPVFDVSNAESVSWQAGQYGSGREPGLVGYWVDVVFVLPDREAFELAETYHLGSCALAPLPSKDVSQLLPDEEPLCGFDLDDELSSGDYAGSAYFYPESRTVFMTLSFD